MSRAAVRALRAAGAVLAAATALPLAGCGALDSALQSARERGRQPSAVTVDVPAEERRATAPESRRDRAFRRDFEAPDRFLRVTGDPSFGSYVLDRRSGCAYSEDPRGARHEILDGRGRPDCRYRP